MGAPPTQFKCHFLHALALSILAVFLFTFGPRIANDAPQTIETELVYQSATNLGPYAPLVSDFKDWIRQTSPRKSYVRQAKQALSSRQSFNSFAKSAIIPMRYSSGEHKGINYSISLPNAFGNEQKRYPLIIELHGIGYVGHELEYAFGNDEAPYSEVIFVSPICESYFGWNTKQLDALLDHLQEILPVNSSRVSLMGHSLGGNAVWRWASERPDRFAAISPWSTWGGYQDIQGMIDVPVKLLHGIDDVIVSPAKHLRIASTLIKQGGNVEIQLLENRGHWIDEMGLRTDVIQWLISHQKQRPLHAHIANHSSEMEIEL